MKQAKLFITHHPDDLLLYRNLIVINRSFRKDTPIFLFKVLHTYYSSFDFAPYEKYFDAIIEFPFIGYRKNIVAGLQELKLFKEKLSEGRKLLSQFRDVDVMVSNSAWLPINALICELSSYSNVTRILRWSMGSPKISQLYEDALSTMYTRVYRLLVRSYKVKVMRMKGGTFADFLYAQDIPGVLVQIVNPTEQYIEKGNQIILPFPLVRTAKTSLQEKRTMVIVFGDAGIFTLSSYIDNKEKTIQRLANFFLALQHYYRHDTLFYKPHPADGDNIMEGMDRSHYQFFDNTLNAQAILDTYYERIKAAYTFSSSSVIWSSLLGIPSYTCYRYLYNNAGVERFDEFFGQNQSNFLYHLKDVDEIGKIDRLQKTIRPIQREHIEQGYLEFLRIS